MNKDMNKEWFVCKTILQGTSHEDKNLDCQDYAAVASKGHKTAIALADGKGKTNVNARGVVEIVKRINQFLIEMYEWILDLHEEEGTIAENLMLQVRRYIEQMSRQWNVDYKELSSTLLGFCADSSTNTYCAIHLGDGVIAIRDRYDQIEILSEPYNGDKINETILSTSEHTLKYVKIYRGHLEDIRGVVLASDGVYEDILDMENIEKFFAEQERNGILDKKEDDQAMIMMSFD